MSYQALRPSLRRDDGVFEAAKFPIPSVTYSTAAGDDVIS